MLDNYNCYTVVPTVRLQRLVTKILLKYLELQPIHQIRTIKAHFTFHMTSLHIYTHYFLFLRIPSPHISQERANCPFKKVQLEH